MAALIFAAPGAAEASIDPRDPAVAADTLNVSKAAPAPEDHLVASVSGAPLDVAQPAIELELPSEAGRAAAYARLYGISSELALQIVESALAEGVDPDLAFRLVRVESVFKVRARGPSGGLGLTQLLPSTARAIDGSLRTEEQILDPQANLRTGFRYLRRMLDLYDGNVKLALLAYNRGETAVNRALRAGRDPSNGYARKVFGVSGKPYAGSGFAGRR